MLGDFFSLDGPFFKYGSLVFDLLILDFLWMFLSGPLVLFLLMVYAGEVLFSLPVIIFYLIALLLILQVGPATTAMFYVTNRKVREDDSYLFKDYFKSFKMNYKQSIIITAVLFVVIAILAINISAILGISIPFLGFAVQGNMFGSMSNILLPLQLFILLEIIFVTIYMYPMLARFHMGTVQLFKTAFILANKHLVTTIISAAIFIGLVALVFIIHPIFFFFLFSGYAMLTSYLFERVFKNYIPDEDDEVEKELDEYSDDYDYDAEQASLAEIFKQKRDEQQSKDFDDK